MKTEERFERLEGFFEMAIKEMKKNSEEMKKNSEEMKKNSQEMKKNSQEMKKVFQRMDESDARTEKRLREVTKQLGDMGVTQGEIGEDLFYRNIPTLFRRRGKTFDTVTRNLKKKGIAEYDIVAVNGEEIFLLEIKNKLTNRMVDDFLRKGIQKFKGAFPQLAQYRVIAGVGGLVVRDEVEKYAEGKGLYVFTQGASGNAEIVNEKNFTPKVFA